MHCFLHEFVVFYVEQVAFAVAVGAAETRYWFIFSAEAFSGFALFRFRSFFIEYFDDFGCGVVQQVVDVPEFSFFVSEVAFHSLF